jgi:hypothetical protein
VINAQGVVTGTVLDPRAELQVFGPSRGQDNTRDLTRYVLGVRGDRDKLFFVDNFSYEVGYTYGEVNNQNIESGVDAERFFLATDAVRDVNNVLGRGAGAIVCRSQLLTGQRRHHPRPVPGRHAQRPKRTGRGLHAHQRVRHRLPRDANNPNATGGGGRPGLTQAQADVHPGRRYGEGPQRAEEPPGLRLREILGDFLPAGPIGIASATRPARRPRAGSAGAPAPVTASCS